MSNAADKLCRMQTKNWPLDFGKDSEFLRAVLITYSRCNFARNKLKREVQWRQQIKAILPMSVGK